MRLDVQVISTSRRVEYGSGSENTEPPVMFQSRATLSAMKSMWVGLAILFAFCSAPSAMATRNLSSTDGNMLLKECHAALKGAEVSPQLTGPEWQAGAHCIGFVQGVLDADAIWFVGAKTSTGDNAKVLYCLPDDSQTMQLIRVLVKFLEDNPEKLNLPGYVLIWVAMAKSYPCSASTH